MSQLRIAMSQDGGNTIERLLDDVPDGAVVFVGRSTNPSLQPDLKGEQVYVGAGEGAFPIPSDSLILVGFHYPKLNPVKIRDGRKGKEAGYDLVLRVADGEVYVAYNGSVTPWQTQRGGRIARYDSAECLTRLNGDPLISRGLSLEAKIVADTAHEDQQKRNCEINITSLAQLNSYISEPDKITKRRLIHFTFPHFDGNKVKGCTRLVFDDGTTYIIDAKDMSPKISKRLHELIQPWFNTMLPQDRMNAVNDYKRLEKYTR
jgi:hypothetical protein